MDTASNITTSDLKRIRSGQYLADGRPGESVVISGISGYFPKCNNVQHLMENLFNKLDLCDTDERRYKIKNNATPKLFGYMNNVDKFDDGFFGIPPQQVKWMDPMSRLLLERTVEALIDAGINPVELRGTNTGVFIGVCYSDTELYSIYNTFSDTYPIVGSMLAHRISYALQLNGPSFILDSACSSGLYAFEVALRSIREGKCDMAIVAGSNISINPNATLQFARLGVLNMNTGCRPFDRDADGYTRSEAIAVLILQKEKCSRRIYARVVHSKTSADGFKEKGITHPSGSDHYQLYKDVYEDCGVDPKTIAYVEAHATGTIIGDPEELSAIDKFFCSNRETPLLIGSIKANIGHSEPVSGLCSIIKLIMAMNFECIPPNIHYDNPRPDVPALMEKRLSVVTEKTKWPKSSNFAGINGFGFGGANCHVVLEKFDKRKEVQQDGVPRLVCFSGRTRDALESFHDYFSTNDLNYEFVRLIHEIFCKDINDHIYRGYTIILPNREVKRSSCFYNKKKYTLYLCLGDEIQNSYSLLNELQQLPPFKEMYQRCLKFFTENDINIDLNEYVKKVLTTLIVQLGIINIFRELKIQFDYIRGYSVGEFAAAYANGVLKLDEAIMACYIISKNYKDLMKSNQKVFEDVYIKLNSCIFPKKIDGLDESISNKHPYGSPSYLLFNSLYPNLAVYTNFEENSVVVSVDFKGEINDTVIHLELFKTKSDDTNDKIIQLKQFRTKSEDTNDNIIQLEQSRTKSDVIQLLSCIGNLYELGFTGRVDKLFSEIQWPVSSGTPFLSPLIKWNHAKSYGIIKKLENQRINDNEKWFEIDVMNKDTSFYKGHVIDGRNLFPATGYIYLAWKILADINDDFQEKTIVCFENIKFLRAITMPIVITFVIVINKEGYFEIVEGNEPVVMGKISVINKAEKIPKPCRMDDNAILFSKKDIYKELKIRGYEYKGLFKAVEQIHGNEGIISWNSNWITFLDNMLQLFITIDDSRLLYVPIGIDRIVIDPASFLQYTEKLDADKHVPCYINKSNNSVHTQGIQIIGLHTSLISRRRQINQPVLETYKFIPNVITTNVRDSLRINMHIVSKNKHVINMKVMEVVDEITENTIQPLSFELVKVLKDIPRNQPDIILYNKNEQGIDIKGITLVKDKITNYYGNVVYIGSNLLKNKKKMQFAMGAILNDGFIITIEDNKSLPSIIGFNILTEHKINDKFVYLLSKRKNLTISKVIDISILENLEYWLNMIKTSNINGNKVILYAQNDNISGILGFINCLRCEEYRDNFSCFFIRDKAPKFDIDDDFYKSQIEKNFDINVYQNGKWGTYRHLLCDLNDKIECEHFYGNTKINGDISSLDWFQGKLSTKHDDICHIYYSSLNFRDVMMATGKIPAVTSTASRIEQECCIGFEFSGRDRDGNRIMGITKCGSLSNLVQCKSTWKVPSDWSLEDAATVPIVYLTVLQAFMEANIKHGSSVLIHSGAGGIGQAALNICHYYNCNIFTTVGTSEKKKYIMEHFRNVSVNHIGNSRDTTFEEMIMRETNGRGVDIVLNSLSEDKLHASIRCLKKGGHFLEIGRFDMSNNNKISVDLLNLGCTYISIMLNFIHTDYCLNTLFQSLIDKSFIKPLNRTVFQIDQLEKAFKYMKTGQHKGKVLINIRDEEEASVIRPTKITHYAIPKFYCDPNLSYVILGGLGGFGIELADWLMLRGAKTLILSSRNGITTGYQQHRIRHWNDNGVNTLILRDDISTYEGCKDLIIKANSAASIGGIFNLAVELRDGLLNNLTYKDFHASLCPKAYATIFLDQISKTLCPNLQQFVVFSSVVSGRGNLGQTNYGMSNSIMERICEERKSQGFPPLAIQWGAIGDVGLVAEMQNDTTEFSIGGTLQQKISSCLDVLDKFLIQNEPVVSSMVVFDKFQTNNSDNLINTILGMIGITDLKTINIHATLSELGMDSIIAIEIKQILERDFDMFLSGNEIERLTFARLAEIQDSIENNPNIDVNYYNIEDVLNINKFDENTYHMKTVDLTINKDTSKTVILIPGIEGKYIYLKTLMNNLKYSSSCLQHNMHGQIEQFEEIVKFYYPTVKDIIMCNNSFNIIAHSFGGAFAFEIISQLEREGYVGKLVLIDSSAEIVLKLISVLGPNFGDEFENNLIVRLLENYLLPQQLPAVIKQLKKAKTTKERIAIIMNVKHDDESVLNNYLHECCLCIYTTLLAYLRYKFSPGAKLKSKIMLCKPTIISVKNVSGDYGLSKYAEKVEIATFNGDHFSLLQNTEMMEAINVFLDG